MRDDVRVGAVQTTCPAHSQSRSGPATRVSISTCARQMRLDESCMDRSVLLLSELGRVVAHRVVPPKAVGCLARHQGAVMDAAVCPDTHLERRLSPVQSSPCHVLSSNTSTITVGHPVGNSRDDRCDEVPPGVTIKTCGPPPRNRTGDECGRRCPTYETKHVRPSPPVSASPPAHPQSRKVAAL